MITIDLNKKVTIKMKVDTLNHSQKEEEWISISYRDQDQKDINFKRIQYKMERIVYRNSMTMKTLD